MENCIPDDRPVNGSDLVALKAKLGLSVTDMSWLLGISANNWNEFTSQQPDESGKPRAAQPVADPAVAIFARWLDLYPETASALIPKWPSPTELFERLKDLPWDPALGRIDRKRFGLTLGRDATTGSRWMRPNAPGSGTPANVDRLLWALSRGLERDGSNAWAQLRHLARTEASFRGEPDLDTAPAWPQGAPETLS